MSIRLAAVTIFLSICLCEARAGDKTSFGIGLGIPYGIAGMNVEHELSERTVLSLGLGSSILAGTAYALGLRFYPDPKQSGLRYSVLYATNAVITDDEPCNSFIPIPFCGEESAHEGLNLALGWSGRSPSNGWDFDLVAIVFSQAWERIEDLEDRGRDIDGDTGPSLKISFGYHWY